MRLVTALLELSPTDAVRFAHSSANAVLPYCQDHTHAAQTALTAVAAFIDNPSPDRLADLTQAGETLDRAITSLVAHPGRLAQAEATDAALSAVYWAVQAAELANFSPSTLSRSSVARAAEKVAVHAQRALSYVTAIAATGPGDTTLKLDEHAAASAQRTQVQELLRYTADPPTPQIAEVVAALFDEVDCALPELVAIASAAHAPQMVSQCE